MASAISHPAIPLALATMMSCGGSRSSEHPRLPVRVWVAGILCSVLPDADVIGFSLGIRYDDMLGHRGLTHSLLFAAVVAGVATLSVRWPAPNRASALTVFLYLLVSTASHGFLDAFTNGGRGVAFFAPFQNHRYFMPWRPIEVSPIGVGDFFSERGLAILRSEIRWIWAPALTITSAFCLLRGLLLGRRPGTADPLGKG